MKECCPLFNSLNGNANGKVTRNLYQRRQADERSMSSIRYPMLKTLTDCYAIPNREKSKLITSPASIGKG